MPAPSSPANALETPVKEATELSDAVHDDEQTDVMGRDELPDFEKPGGSAEADERRPPQRPSTFTRLLLNPRR